MELTEKEAHCIARLLQGAMFGKSIFDGCAFCKFKCKVKNDPAPHLDKIRMLLTEATGVDLGWNGNTAFRPDDFQYHRFLKNSNDEMKQKIANYFKNCEVHQEL